MGFISLSPNSSTNFKARELQSVSVIPRHGTHLKLRLGKPFHNDLNTSNQVALVAVNVIGYDSFNEANSAIPTNTDKDEALISICDDLSFSMYVDETICETIRKIELKKTNAVNG